MLNIYVLMIRHYWNKSMLDSPGKPLLSFNKNCCAATISRVSFFTRSLPSADASCKDLSVRRQWYCRYSASLGPSWLWGVVIYSQLEGYMFFFFNANLSVISLEVVTSMSSFSFLYSYFGRVWEVGKLYGSADIFAL